MLFAKPGIAQASWRHSESIFLPLFCFWSPNRAPRRGTDDSVSSFIFPFYTTEELILLKMQFCMGLALCSVLQQLQTMVHEASLTTSPWEQVPGLSIHPLLLCWVGLGSRHAPTPAKSAQRKSWQNLSNSEERCIFLPSCSLPVLKMELSVHRRTLQPLPL